MKRVGVAKPEPPTVQGEEHVKKHKPTAKLFHAEPRPSLLSSEATAQNYRGIINLALLVLVCLFFICVVICSSITSL
jgi:hypothetical protein